MWIVGEALSEAAGGIRGVEGQSAPHGVRVVGETQECMAGEVRVGQDGASLIAQRDLQQ